MRSIVDRHRSRPRSLMQRAASAWRTAALAPLLLAAVACGDITRLVSPGSKGPSGPAMVAFTASVPRRVSTANDVVTLNVTALYLRADGTRVKIGSQQLTLTSDPLQSVPIPVDVGTCLADASRDVSGSTAATASTACAVILELALAVNGVIVDQQTVGPLRLSPGGTTTVSQPVTLIDLASVDILQPGGAIVLPTDVLQAFLGSSLGLTARVLDTRGAAVTDRAATWTSDAPTVAAVDANTGVVTGVAIGSARITARIGTITSGANVRVVRAPAALTIGAGAGSGTGTIRSTPAGIDCKVSGQSLTGTCVFTFPGDAAVALTSSAEPGSVFGAWADACTASSIGPTCQVTMSQARTASARFTALRRVVVTAGALSDGRGRVTGANGLDCRMTAGAISGTCLVEVPEGAAYQLTAAGEPTPNGGTQQFFAGWGGDCASATGPTCTVTPGANSMAITARFADVQSITVALSGVGGGLVTGGSTIACTRAAGVNSGNCAESATFGTSVTLTAIPDAQSVFGGWTGACTGQAQACTTTLSQARSVGATFSRRKVALTTTLNGPGAGAVLVNGVIACSTPGNVATTTCSDAFDIGTSITLSATAVSSSQFTGFTGACSGTAPCTIVLTAPLAVTATFSVAQFPLTITLSGTGAGTLVSSDGMTCTSTITNTVATCTKMVSSGTTVSVNASPTVESTFDGYSGDCTGKAACSFAMTAPRSISATFTRRQVQITVQLSGTGGGTVTGGGAAFCTMALAAKTATCVKMVDYGSTIVFAGNPGFESTFDDFGGDCTGGTTCSLTVVSPSTVTALFKRRQVPLTIAISGTGAGTVSIDGSVVCSLLLGQKTVSCTRTADVGATLELVGAPAISSLYNGFTGDCTGTGKCSLVISAAHTVNAGFTRRQVPLTMRLTGQGGGVLTIDGLPACTLPLGDGTATCSKLVDYGAPLVFAGNATAESVFDTFGGDCSAGTSCTLTPTAASSVTGVFSRKQLPLTLTMKGTGGGTTYVNGVASCTLASGQAVSTCTKMLDYGAMASISTSPISGSSLDGLSGDCSGASVCTVTMTAARAVDAMLTLRQVTLTFILSGSGSGVMTINETAACTLPPASASAVTCTRLVAIGTTVTIGALPTGGATFGGYGADCANAPRVGTSCSLGMSGPRTVTSNFGAAGPSAAGINQPVSVPKPAIKPNR